MHPIFSEIEKQATGRNVLKVTWVKPWGRDGWIYATDGRIAAREHGERWQWAVGLERKA